MVISDQINQGWGGCTKIILCFANDISQLLIYYNIIIIIIVL